MGLIRLQNVTRQFGGHVVLRDVSLELNTNETVGLVGANGAGKTTLFKLIAGKLAPDLGTVTRSKGLDVGYLSQEPEIDAQRTLHEEVGSAFGELLRLERQLHDISERMSSSEGEALEALMHEYEKVNERFIAGGGYDFEARLNEIVGGLGFTQADQDLRMGALSGGQKCRAALAKLLLEDNTLLLLDEPTNHLDLDAVRWLERFLAGHKGGAVIISHDRFLLDRLVDRIIEVENQQVAGYPGNYSNFAQIKQRRRLTQARQFEKDREHIEKQQAFIRKHMAGQRTKEAQGRRKRLEREIAEGRYVLEKPEARQRLTLDFGDAALDKRVVLRGAGLSKSYADKTLFEDVSLEVNAGARIAITGPNGTGKSTLLKILLGEIEPDRGQVHRDPKAVIGYYAQEAQDLDPRETMLGAIREVRGEYTEQQARSLLARFGFRGEDVFKPLGGLSGGEQSRVRLIKLILSMPNVLVMDEPTNHLDIPSREALEEALTDYPGTLLCVSHDRYFIDRIAQRLVVMRAGEFTNMLGNYSDYVERMEAADPRRQEKQRKKARKREKAKQRAAGEAKPPRTRYQRMKLDELEEFIGGREAELAGLEEAFGDSAVYQDPEKLEALQEEYERLKDELEQAEAAWLERAESSE